MLKYCDFPQIRADSYQPRLLMNSQTPGRLANILMEETVPIRYNHRLQRQVLRIDGTNRSLLRTGIEFSYLPMKQSCIICQHIPIIAGYQQDLEFSQISDLDVIDCVRMCMWHIASDGGSCSRSRYMEYEVRHTWECLAKVPRNRNVDVVYKCGEVEL